MSPFYLEMTGKQHLPEQAFFMCEGNLAFFRRRPQCMFWLLFEHLFPQWRSLGCGCEWQALSMWGRWVNELELLKARRICNTHSFLVQVARRKLELTDFTDCRAFKDSKGKKLVFFTSAPSSVWMSTEKSLFWSQINLIRGRKFESCL